MLKWTVGMYIMVGSHINIYTHTHSNSLFLKADMGHTSVLCLQGSVWNIIHWAENQVQVKKSKRWGYQKKHPLCNQSATTFTCKMVLVYLEYRYEMPYGLHVFFCCAHLIWDRKMAKDGLQYVVHFYNLKTKTLFWWCILNVGGTSETLPGYVWWQGCLPH